MKKLVLFFTALIGLAAINDVNAQSPTATCKNITVALNSSGLYNIIAADTLNNGSTGCGGSLSYSVTPSAFTCSNLGTPVTVTLTVTDGTCGGSTTSTCTATVTVIDVTPPTATCAGSPVLALDNTGNATLQVSTINNGSTDNCNTMSFGMGPQTIFNCTHIGTITITLTVTDGSNNASTCTSLLSVEDQIPPVAVCNPITVQLDNAGGYTLTSTDEDNIDVSTDNCSIVTNSVTPSTFNCSNTSSPVSVTLTVTDPAPTQSSTCATTVTVEDNVDPIAICQNVSANLDAGGSATTSAALVDNGSSDACGIASLVLTQSTFACNEYGPNTETLTVTDNNGNTTTCTATVTVQDLIAPNAICAAITVLLDGSGNGTFSASGAFGSSSTDNCPAQLLHSASQTSFTCTDLGSNNITLTVTDQGSNTDTDVCNVEVMDMVAPVADCKDITVQLDAAGGYTMADADINDASTDNCTSPLTLFSASQTVFNCGSVASSPNTVTLTVTDANANSSTCTAGVTVQDVTAPVVTCQNISVALDVNGNATITNTAVHASNVEACGVSSFATSPSAFTCSDEGNNTVTLSVTDINNNTGTCTAIVDVVDNQVPVAGCTPITVNLDATGNYTLTSGDVTAIMTSSTDNCTLTGSVSPSTFTCSDVAVPVNVTLTVTDPGNNNSTCATTVDVQDVTPPTATCISTTPILNFTGSGGSFTQGQIDGFLSTASDACGIVANTISPTGFGCSVAGTTITLTLTVTDVNGNTNTCTALLDVNDNEDPVAVCNAITVNLDGSGNASISTITFATGSTDNCDIVYYAVNDSTFNCSEVGVQSVTLTIKDTNQPGNDQTCSANVTVVDNAAPTANCTTITVFLDAGSNATVGQDGDYTLTQGDQDAIGATSTDNCSALLTFSVTPTLFTCANIGSNSVTLTVTDPGNNTDTEVCNVEVRDNIPPVVDCAVTTVALDINGIYDLTVDGGGLDTLVYLLGNTGTYDNCTDPVSLVITSSMTHFTCANVGGPIAVTLTVTDASGNSAQKTTCTVTVVDLVPPTAICQNRTVALDMFGQYHISDPDTVDNGSNDACGLHGTTPFSLAGQLDYTCADIGSPETVTLTVMDVNSNTTTCAATITTIDITAPTCVGQNGFIFLDSAGKDTISFAYVLNSYYDACGIVDYELSDSTFECSQVPSVLLTLTVTDGSANTGTCTASMTIVDNTGPVAQCQDVTIYLDGSGIATTDTIAVNNGSLDQCSGSNLTFNLTPTTFNCANVFTTNIVTLTVTDIYTNNHTCTAQVTVLDTTPPNAVCVGPITVNLDATGNAAIDSSDVDNGSNDNCTFVMNVSPNTFDCGDIPGNPNVVTLTVTDASNNTDACTVNVTIMDVTPPTMVCQNVSVNLDATGNATVSALDVDNGSSDACGIANYELNDSLFDCADVSTSPNVVTLTVTDVNSNTNTCTATISVFDVTPPNALCQNVTVILDGSGNATANALNVNNGSTDACGIDGYSLSDSLFVCADAGTNPNAVVLTVTDVNNNTATCAADVTVLDTQNPTAICQNITVNLDATGNATITDSQVDNGSNDNCTISYSTTPTAFDCSDIPGNPNIVTLTVTDIPTGNTGTCTAEVTVMDVTPPTTVCQNVSVNLDATGNATVSALDVDNGSTDACGIANYELNDSLFECADVLTSPHTVTLTVTDVNANTNTCTATVTVFDVTNPVATCQNVTIFLDANGNATANALNVNNGSTDACGIDEYQLSDSLFTCADISTNPNAVTLTVTDIHNNTQTCAASVTVLDNINPTAVCQNITVNLDAFGNATINAAMVDNGSDDNCTFTLSISTSSFTCSEVGANNVTLTVTDIPTGNTDQCVSIVTINDVTPPVALCQNVTVSLDASGNGSTTAAAVNNGSTDACGIFSLSLSQTAFDCGDVGINNVTLTVTDNNANTDQCTADVLVQDLIAPIANCQAVTVWLDGLGGATASALSVNNGSTDACGINSYVLMDSTFTCANIGNNTVTLTVTDVNNNSATCVHTVTVIDTFPAIRISGDDSVIIGDVRNYSIIPHAGSGHTYVWTVVGGNINSGQGTTTVNVTWTMVGNQHIYIYDSVPSTGCVYQHDTNIFVASVRYCFFNNGRYTNPAPLPGCNNVSSLANVQTLLSTPLIIGDCGKTQTLTMTDASCLINRISRAGTSFTYSGCLDSIASPFNGIPFWTDVIGEIVALGLNLRENSSLDSFELVTRTFLTEQVSNCFFASGPVGPGVRYSIPQSVWDALPNKTVGELYDMANRALGGCPAVGDPSMRDILNALVYLNEGFNGCRYLVSFSLNHVY